MKSQVQQIGSQVPGEVRLPPPAYSNVCRTKFDEFSSERITSKTHYKSFTPPHLRTFDTYYRT